MPRACVRPHVELLSSEQICTKFGVTVVATMRDHPPPTLAFLHFQQSQVTWRSNSDVTFSDSGVLQCFVEMKLYRHSVELGQFA